MHSRLNASAEFYFDCEKAMLTHESCISWGHYQWVGDHDEKPTWAKTYPSGQKTGFLQSAVSDLKVALETYLTTKPTSEDIDAWFDVRISLNDVLVSQLQAVEDFCEKRRLGRLSLTVEGKNAREEFYQKKAESLDPQIELEVLKECDSYRRAIAISRAPANLDRSWRTLLPKIKVEATAIIAKKKQLEDLRCQRQQLHLNYAISTAHRLDSPEQCFVLGLADTVIDEIKCFGTKVADVDLIPLILQEVYDTYESLESKPQESGARGPYRLTMDDARMIYRLKIFPILDRLGDSTCIIQAKQLECDYCDDSGNDPCGRSMYCFEALFNHVFNQHRELVWGSNEVTNMANVLHESGESGWLRMEWPMKLPFHPAYPNDGSPESTALWESGETFDYQGTQTNSSEEPRVDDDGSMALYGVDRLIHLSDLHMGTLSH